MVRMYRLVPLVMRSCVGHLVYGKPVVIEYKEVMEQTALLGDTRKVVEKDTRGKETTKGRGS